jgi:carboxynorspermidine decarboxylase
MEKWLPLVPTPCYVVDETLVLKNLEILKSVQKKSGANIILALKGFAMHSLFPLISQYLKGVTASSVNEALLGQEYFKKEIHVYAPAYKENEIYELLEYANHISFNSFGQWKQYKEKCLNHPGKTKFGMRINPEHSEVKTALYDPCSPHSRLGMTLSHFEFEDLEGLSGLHFHTLCELNSDALERTLKVVEKKFGSIIKNMQWINFGGGHHITRADYEVEKLCNLINDFKSKYNVEVYLEPGEAIALNTGYLVTTVLDIFENGKKIALLDTSATAHMPDVLEMPYRPEIEGAGAAEEKAHSYRLGGLTCLAGDVIGDYSFENPLKIGDKLVFKDMAHYTMVKNTSFNGVPLPSLAVLNSKEDSFKVIKEFDYSDYKNRLS